MSHKCRKHLAIGMQGAYCKQCGKVVKKNKVRPKRITKARLMTTTASEVNQLLITKEKLQEVCTDCHKLPCQSHTTLCGLCEIKQDQLIRDLEITGFKVQ